MTGCAILEGKDKTAGWTAEEFLSTGQKQMSSGDWVGAIETYKKLLGRFPYGRSAEQAQQTAAAPGLRAEVLRALQPKPLRATLPDVCSICLSAMRAGQAALTLECKHDFHAKCITEWLTKCSHVCPSCSAPVLPAEELGEC